MNIIYVMSPQTAPHLSTHSTCNVATALRSPQLLVREILAGVITALALIPEVISFSVIVGVGPMVSLQASIVLCLVTSVLGGRPAMVTAAAGSVALVIGPMVHTHGVDYILPAVILAGLFQVGFGLAGLGRMMHYIPRSVMMGFVNALGILIFAAQIPHLLHKNELVYGLFIATIAIVTLLPPTADKGHSLSAGGYCHLNRSDSLCPLSVPNVGNEGDMTAGLFGLTPLMVP